MIKGVSLFQLIQITIYQHFTVIMLNLQSLTNTHTIIHYLQQKCLEKIFFIENYKMEVIENNKNSSMRLAKRAARRPHPT